MPVLRSSTRQASSETTAKASLKRGAKAEENPVQAPKRAKRVNVAKHEDDSPVTKTKPVKAVKSKTKTKKPPEDDVPRVLNPVPAPPPLPAVLSFSFEDARSQLISTDPRFEDLFTKLECRPFQHLESVDPFR